MTIQTRKQEIVRSLDKLDVLQSEKVLIYIQALQRGQHKPMRHHRSRRRAMKEIGQALQQFQVR